jgi:hypothetical protein
MASKKSLNDKLRALYMEKVKCYLIEEQDEEVLITGSNELCIPCVDAEGNDEFMVITFKVPTGSRDGDPYDGYEMAQDYEMKCKAKAEKAKESAQKKAEKIARDKAAREAKAKAKAEHQKEKEEA